VEALELLSMSLACGPHSQLSEPLSSSGSDLFEEWPKVNDMAVSVYVALTVDASSSRTSAISAPHSEREPRADGSAARPSRSRVTPS
jgi:hypothetical protein